MAAKAFWGLDLHMEFASSTRHLLGLYARYFGWAECERYTYMYECTYHIKQL